MLSALMRLAPLFLLLSLAAAGCVREPYTRAEPVRFQPGAPAGLVFPSLVQHAAALGYVIDGVDATRGVFAVHSRMLGRPPRRARYDRSGPMRSNLFLVQVQDAEVLVTAIGRHVGEDGMMHPTLAQELEIFGDSMRRASRAVTRAMTAGGAMPEPPSAYGGAGPVAQPYGAPPTAQPPTSYGAPPTAQPPSSYGAAPTAQPPGSYDAPPTAPPPGSYGAAPTAQPPGSYGAPPTAPPPGSYGAPPTAQPPGSYGPPPGAAPPSRETDVSPGRRLGDPRSPAGEGREE